MISFPSFDIKVYNMDKEQIVLLAGVTVCVLSISAFIFWGPTPVNKRRGAVVGLQNLGLTCFLNTLLQSLASCVNFIEWLETCKDQGPVASSLHFVLKVLSSERSRLPASIEDPLAPTCVIKALQQHGWSLGQGEQDAHELFHLLMVSLEEEAHKALAAETGLLEVLGPKLATSGGDACDKPEELNHSELKNDKLSSTESSVGRNAPSGDLQTKPSLILSKQVNRHGEPITRRVIPKYDCNRNHQQSPFCGLLTSQLQCVKCSFKSVLRYDKFDSLSLHLPDKQKAGHTLCQLLGNYTQPEAVSGVVCDGCNKQLDSSQPPITSTSLKTLTVGKLPKCLCIHIHRMSIGPNGSPYKRSDYVDFPEYLVMDRFTHKAIAKEQKLKGETPSREGKEVQSVTSNIIFNGQSCNHLYKLKAVVVHCGTVESGHFVTYRRGPLNTSTRHRSERWYFTSDDTVREASLAEAMQALAYMLFYEKCAMTPT